MQMMALRLGKHPREFSNELSSILGISFLPKRSLISGSRGVMPGERLQGTITADCD
jgi:hypothetical protein